MILALDIAEHLGIAYTTNNNLIATTVLHNNKLKHHASAQMQLDYILDFPLDTIILIEDFVYFDVNRNRSKLPLIKRLGYLEYSLRNAGFTVELLHVNAVRKEYCKDKPKQKRIEVKNKQGIIKLNENGKPKFKLDGIKPKEWIQQQIIEYANIPILTTDHTDAILMLMSYQKLSYENIRNKIILV